NLCLHCDSSLEGTWRKKQNRKQRPRESKTDLIEEPMAQTEVMPAVIKPRGGRTADPCGMVIFGYSGDLTRRKLIPALYNLASQQLLSREFAVIGVGRTPMSDDDARKKVTEGFKHFAT